MDEFRHLITLEVQAFILDRRSRGLSRNTIEYYIAQLKVTMDSLDRQGIKYIEDITPDSLRQCMLELSTHRTNGGVCSWYRACKAWLRWFENEQELDDWRNPIMKIRPPRVSTDPLPGVTPEVIRLLVGVCDKSYYGVRNKAIILFMYDTGVRVTELCDILFQDVSLEMGTVLIRHGKGDRARTVFIGTTARRDLIKYLRYRHGIQPTDPLFSHQDGKRFTREGIESVIDSLAKKAHVDPPPRPHDFRRAFTKAALKRTDVVTVARLLGHSSTALVWRYYHQDIEDLHLAHQQASPADNLR